MEKELRSLFEKMELWSELAGPHAAIPVTPDEFKLYMAHVVTNYRYTYALPAIWSKLYFQGHPIEVVHAE